MNYCNLYDHVCLSLIISVLIGTEVKQEFKDNCSVQVYSVQACIPKDLALLWSAEFVQAEQLFSQPLTTENCLRDNRCSTLFFLLLSHYGVVSTFSVICHQA